MRYVHVCSLYHYILKYEPFPTGHPQFITMDFADVREYVARIYFRVLPLRDQYPIQCYPIRMEENYSFPYVELMPIIATCTLMSDVR